MYSYTFPYFSSSEISLSDRVGVTVATETSCLTGTVLTTTGLISLGLL